MKIEQKRVSLGNRSIGDGEPCFIVFEAGPTHDGLETAMELVRLSAEAGADAVKFQILDPDRLVSNRNQMFKFDILVDRESGESRTVEKPLYDLLKSRALTEAEWRELKVFSDSLGLAFFATIAFEDEIELVTDLNCNSIKIASADVNHIPLIKQAARTGACIQLDTGNSTLGDIEAAVDAIVDEGNDNIVIHQCPSGYPARLESVNLRIIQTIKQMFGFPAAYSDHVPGWEMDIAAVAMGANMVEKTITLDRTTPSVEHIMSIEPIQMTQFVKAIRNVETAMGSPRRVMGVEEKAKRDALRRSTFLMQDSVKGARLGDLKVEFRRPGFGLSPADYVQLTDSTLTADMRAGSLIKRSSLT